MPTARRLVRQQDGAAAVEFALVAAPFLAMVFAIIETAIVFFAGQALETAAADSARLIMTGQAQNAGYDQAKFKEAVCAQDLRAVQLQRRSVRRREELSDVRQHSHRQADHQRQHGHHHRLLARRARRHRGGQLMYQWPVYVSLLGLNLSDLSGGKRLLMSTVAFRNEPYK